METQEDTKTEDRKVTIRIIVRILTVLASVPFMFCVFMVVIFAHDSPYSASNRSLAEITGALFLVPMLLLAVSLFSKTLYWLWLVVMGVISAVFFGHYLYNMNTFMNRNNNVITANKKDFDCFEPVSKTPFYLSIKDNGDIIEVSSSGGFNLQSDVGNIDKNGVVVFTGNFTKEIYKEGYLSCKDQSGRFLKDAYKTVLFSNQTNTKKMGSSNK